MVLSEGIDSFERIIQKGYYYVDKTLMIKDILYHHKKDVILITRPRRFGKSLLTSTLHSYFSGEKELFEGLKIMTLEQEWMQFPVLHFDLSGAKHMPAQGVRDELSRLLDKMEEDFGTNPKEKTPGMRLAGLIERAYEQTGRQVVVIIDEYDAPLLDVLHEDERLIEMSFGEAEGIPMDELPDDFVCPLCKHGAADFEPIS